ncbi:hypothetical protein [Dendronalium sp. ChiSLP03b]|uniref:hypothetical protein n=1 Tax=Dendronalium sp. ChiSLP03b TaxID=3075381 RepID=UPI002AD3107C|nr:hypothetical protein [Dendronalium sp. ChiSLP03b]MDZ8206877.1 hypothetical protein [Dendronalium sp. ChiSLP03b]
MLPCGKQQKRLQVGKPDDTCSCYPAESASGDAPNVATATLTPVAHGGNHATCYPAGSALAVQVGRAAQRSGSPRPRWFTAQSASTTLLTRATQCLPNALPHN